VTAIPDAVTAVIAAAYDDYRQTTPTDQQTPQGAAEQAVHELIASGWTIRIPTKRRARCPHCTVRHLITQNGRIRRHGPHANPCPGSGTPAHNPERQTT
jgi:hypothetical protein